MIRRRAAIAAAAAALLAGLTGGSAQAASGGTGVPTNWVHHQEAPWSWWTPPHWVNSHDNYDLNVSSPTGALWAKFGFSAASVFVPGGTPAQNAAAWFTYWSRQLRGTPDLYGLGISTMHYTDSSRISEHPPTISGYSDDFRIRLTYVGQAVDGTNFRGHLLMDYVESNLGDTGIESYKVAAAPRTNFRQSLRVLRTVLKFIAYTGSLT